MTLTLNLYILVDNTRYIELVYVRIKYTIISLA